MKYPVFRGIRCYRCNMWKRLNKGGVFRSVGWWGDRYKMKWALYQRKKTGNRRAAYRTAWPAVWKVLDARQLVITLGDDPGPLPPSIYPGSCMGKTYRDRMQKIILAQEDILRRQVNERQQPDVPDPQGS